MEWFCKNCDKPTEHELEYITDETKRPKSYLSARLTCGVCKTYDWATDDVFDSHTCHGNGNWCFCNDTQHQHCVECDSICNIDPTFEP